MKKNNVINGIIKVIGLGIGATIGVIAVGKLTADNGEEKPVIVLKEEEVDLSEMEEV